jgi:hypothetical protein
MKKVNEIVYENATVKIYFNSEYREYVCRLFIDNKEQKDAAYFTDDKDDANDTAKLMLSFALIG